MPIAIAPMSPPGTLKGRGRSGSRKRSTAKRHEFQEQAGTVEKDVERDQAGEAQPEAHRPSEGEGDDCDPGCARFLLQLTEDGRKHAVLRHRQRQARVAHDERVEHAEGADQAAEDDSHAKERSADQAGDVRPRTGFPGSRLQTGHPHRGKGQDVADGYDADRDEHGAGISPLRALDFGGDGGSVVPSHVVPHADEEASEDVDGGGGRLGDSIGQRSHFEGGEDNDRGERGRQGEEQPERGQRDDLHTSNIKESAGDDNGERDPPSAIRFLKPREHTGQVGDEEGGIDRHIKDRGNERQPGFLKSPEVAHRAADPGVITAFVGQRARQLADHEGRGEAPEQRGDEQNQNGASVPGAMHDVFGAIGSTRHHKEGGGDQRPKREADEFLPVGDNGEGLGIFGLLPASCCQFLCLPPQATHSHHRVSLESLVKDVLFRGSRV